MSFKTNEDFLNFEHLPDFFNHYGIDPQYGYPHDLDFSESKVRIDPTPLKRVLHKEHEQDSLLFDEHPLVRDLFGDFDECTQEDLDREKSRILNEEAPGLESSHSPCAWYNPMHFYRNWGIYMKGTCLVRIARRMACFVDWSKTSLPKSAFKGELLRAAFYMIYLHEQFHHKVESFSLRLLVSTGRDHYSPYSSQVYQPTFRTQQCLEESLANAQSYRRLSEKRYRSNLSPFIYQGVRDYVKLTMPTQPPGYREGIFYLKDQPHQSGVCLLQSQVQSANLMPTIPTQHWKMAPNMMRALKPISSRIYIVLPVGYQPLFPPQWKP